MSINPALAASDWEKFIFDVSLTATAILTGAVAFLTVVLFVRKIIDKKWISYCQSRRDWLDLLLNTAVQGSGDLTKAHLSTLNWADRHILKKLVFEKSENAGNDALARYAEIYELIGYAEHHIQTLQKSWFWWKRAEAAHHLGNMKIRRAKEALVKALDDSSIEVRLEATWAVGHMGFVSELPKIVKSMSYFFKIAALRMDAFIFDMGKPAFPALLDLCRHPEYDVRLLAIHIVAEFKDVEALPILVENLRADSLECRLGASKAIGTLGDKEGLKHLIPFTQDPSWQIKAQVAKQFGRNKFVEGIPALLKCMEDQAWWVRRNTGEAFSLMGAEGKNALLETKKSADRYARDMADQWLDDMETSAS